MRLRIPHVADTPVKTSVRTSHVLVQYENSAPIKKKMAPKPDAIAQAPVKSAEVGSLGCSTKRLRQSASRLAKRAVRSASVMGGFENWENGIGQMGPCAVLKCRLLTRAAPGTNAYFLPSRPN